MTRMRRAGPVIPAFAVVRRPPGRKATNAGGSFRRARTVPPCGGRSGHRMAMRKRRRRTGWRQRAGHIRRLLRVRGHGRRSNKQRQPTWDKPSRDHGWPALNHELHARQPRTEIRTGLCSSDQKAFSPQIEFLPCPAGRKNQCSRGTLDTGPAGFFAGIGGRLRFRPDGAGALQ